MSLTPCQPTPDLSHAVAHLERWLDAYSDEQGTERDRLAAQWATQVAAWRREPECLLARVVSALALNPTEAAAVIAAVALCTQPRFAGCVGRAGARTASRGLTAALALDAFAGPGAARLLDREGPVRSRGLLWLGVEAAAASGPLARRLESSGTLVRALTGAPGLGSTLAAVAELDHPTMRRHDFIGASASLDALFGLTNTGVAGHVLVTGPPGSGKTALSAALAGELGRARLVVRCADLRALSAVEQEEAAADLCALDLLLAPVVVLQDPDKLLPIGGSPLVRAALKVGAPALWTTRQARDLGDLDDSGRLLHISLTEAGAKERQQLWEQQLPCDQPIGEDVDLPTLASTYELDGAAIARAARVARALSGPDASLRQGHLTRACDLELRALGEERTQITRPEARLSDIVLDEELRRRVQQLLAACRHRARVLDGWGFGERIRMGTGITALLDGPPGTGKTLLAEVLAGELDRPLYRVSLPDVVSKWVGETEKHLRDVFRAARAARAVLLFDEADSLFASRSNEASSATERYANMEVNLLLQEMERFPGVCVLTTNHFGALDAAVIRRIQFRLTFEPPTERERAQIWRTLCPAAAPLCPSVDFAALALRYDLPGGHIKNALLRAAYDAADAGEAISQRRLAEACRDECRATGRLVVEDDDWRADERAEPGPPEVKAPSAAAPRERPPAPGRWQRSAA